MTTIAIIIASVSVFVFFGACWAAILIVTAEQKGFNELLEDDPDAIDEQWLTLGTKTLLFGVHQIFVHTILVTWAWRHLYKSWPNWQEFVCICIHDIGYWGKPSLKDADGDKHPELGAKLAGWLFGEKWRDFCLGHSSFYVHRNGIKASKLMAADKYWHCMVPLWFYKILAVPTGEFKHYRELQHARQVASVAATDEEWWANLQRICREKVAGVYEIGSDLDNGDTCPECGAEEVDAFTSRTVYGCGSSDYDQRPGTFKVGWKCCPCQQFAWAPEMPRYDKAGHHPSCRKWSKS